MSTCYEFALNCDLKSGVSQEVIDTLTYMTRSGEDESEFETIIDHPLFVTEVIDFGEGDEYFSEWKSLIQNTQTYCEEIMPGITGSIFRDLKLAVRQFLHDDTFSNKFYLLLDWLVSICESDGFVGYYINIHHSNLGRESDPTLIYFINGKVFEKLVDKNSSVSIFDDE
jgi:hypothetical protein